MLCFISLHPWCITPVAAVCCGGGWKPKLLGPSEGTGESGGGCNTPCGAQTEGQRDRQTESETK